MADENPTPEEGDEVAEPQAQDAPAAAEDAADAGDAAADSPAESEDASGAVADNDADADAELTYATDSESPAASLSGAGLAMDIMGKSMDRLKEALPNVQWTSDPNGGPFVIAVISTRADSGAAARQVRALEDRDIPVVAVVHPGGESVGTALLAAGATTTVAEGNEARLASLVADAAIGGGLVEAFHAHTAASSTRHRALITDPGTGLGGLLAFDAAIAESINRPTAPRVMVITAQDLLPSLDSMNDGLASVLRRRIAQGWAVVMNDYSAELFAIDDSHFAALVDIEEDEMDAVIDRLQETTTVFAPSRGRRLEIAIGHAGPEDHPDVNALRDLAERACESALQLKRQGVSAEDLVEAVAERTELITLLQAVRELEREHAGIAGRSERLTDIAVGIGEAMKLGTSDLNRLRVAARFSDVGLVGIEEEHLPTGDGTEPDSAEYRAHTARGERMLTPSAGTIIAKAVRHSHELLDGSGFPDGLTGDEVPMLSRILVVAHTFELAMSAPGNSDDALGQVMAVLDNEDLYDSVVTGALGEIAGRLRMGRLASAS